MKPELIAFSCFNYLCGSDDECFFETMKRIVDGAPEWADNFNVYIAAYGSGRVLCNGDVLLDNLRDQLAKREPMELRAVDIPHGTIVLEK